MNLQIGNRKLMHHPKLVTIVRIEEVQADGHVLVSWPKGRHQLGRWVTTLNPVQLLDITEKPRRPRPEHDNTYDYIPLWSDIPALYSHEDAPLAEQVVYIKLFSPTMTWYLTEFSEVAPDGYRGWLLATSGTRLNRTSANGDSSPSMSCVTSIAHPWGCRLNAICIGNPNPLVRFVFSTPHLA